jgi:dCTP deaminase
MILSDLQIQTLIMQRGMIDKPVLYQESGAKDSPKISYGLSSYGYDIRVADEFKVFKKETGVVLDPKNFDHDAYYEVHDDRVIIPANGFTLARSVEYFKMPKNVTGVVLGKSTYARLGLCFNFTPLEAGWEGHITIEISNTTPLPCKVYANEGIAQVLFFQGDPCKTTYADRNGKYQGQTGITPAIV